MVALLVQALPVGHAAKRCRIHRVRVNHHDILLVDREPVLHAVTQALKQHVRIIAKRIDSGTIAPAASGMQCKRQVKVEERHNRFNAMGNKRIDQAIIELQARLVHPSRPLRHHARPAYREAIRLEAQFRHQRDVLFQVMVMIARNFEIGHASRGLVQVLQRHAFAILIPCPFDLIGRRGCSPQKPGGKRRVRCVKHDCLHASLCGGSAAHHGAAAPPHHHHASPLTGQKRHPPHRPRAQRHRPPAQSGNKARRSTHPSPQRRSAWR